MKPKKGDIIWAYFAQFLTVFSGIIILPFLVRNLESSRLDLYYILLNFTALTFLVDFGFSSQLSRSLTYVLSGGQKILKEGVQQIELNSNKPIDYRLVKLIIHSTKRIYLYLGLGITTLLVSIGWIYLRHIFTSILIKELILIWTLFILGFFLNVYYYYYNSLLIGCGLIKQSQKVQVSSKLIQLFITFVLLLIGLDIYAVLMGNLALSLSRRILGSKYLKEKFKTKLSGFHISREEVVKFFKVVWANSKKLGLTTLSAYVLQRSIIFFVGAYFQPGIISSFGVLMQLGILVNTVSGTVMKINFARFTELNSIKSNSGISEFSLQIIIYNLLFLIGSIFVIVAVPMIFEYLNFGLRLPEWHICLMYFAILFLEGHHSHFAVYISTMNKIPFVKSALISALVTLGASYIYLQNNNPQLEILILIGGAIQLAYNNWRWPVFVLKEESLTYLQFINKGLNLILVKYSDSKNGIR